MLKSHSYRYALKCTAIFIKEFGASLDPRLWMKLVLEEAAEVAEAWTEGDREHILKESADLMYVTAGLELVSADGASLDLLPDGEGDAFSTALEAAKASLEGIGEILFTDNILAEAIARVHASNMSKLGDDGKPIKREDGKILKGPNYKEPDLSDLV